MKLKKPIVGLESGENIIGKTKATSKKSTKIKKRK